MKMFLDTANLDEIRDGVSLGVVVLEAAKMGSHIGTMPYKVFQQLFHHPLTDKGLQAFLADWEKARGTLGNILQRAAASKVGTSN